MSPRSLTNWTKHWNKLSRHTPRRRPARRTRLPLRPELLEDRIVLSFATVASFNVFPDGAFPIAGLLRDSSGNLFGTTGSGGAFGQGAVFEIAAGSRTITTLASFTGTSGYGPQSALVEDSSGDLFGTTVYTTPSVTDGTVFEVAAGSGTITTLASFDGSNGWSPWAGLVEDSSGNLFGTTAFGGPSNAGNVFEVTAGSNTITTLVTFNGSNGAYPRAALFLDNHGNLFGTTEAGGSAGSGSVFKLQDPNLSANSQSLYDGENTAKAVTLTSTDPNGDPLTFTVTNPANGILSGSAPNLIYTPNPGFTGSDSFQFSVTDTATGLVSNAATVSITVVLPPTASSLSLADGENMPIAVTLTSTDPNGHPLTFTVTNPANGTLTGSAPNLVYTPNPGFTGSDSFQFSVTEAVSGLISNTATVSIAIQPPLVSISGLPPGNTTTDNTFTLVTASATHPANPNSADVFSYYWTVSRNGNIFASESGGPTFGYSPDDNGTDIVSVTATDAYGATTAPAGATITVVNGPPTVSVYLSQPLPWDASNTPTAPVGTLLAFGSSVSDSPADIQHGFGYAWSVTQGGSTYTLPTGTVTNASTFSFTPTTVGNYAVNVVATDKDGGATTGTQAIDVTGMDATSLQNVVNLWGLPGRVVFVTLQTDPTQVNAVINAVNAVVAPIPLDRSDDNPPVVVTLNLTSGSYQAPPDLVVSLQPNVTVIINGVNGSTTFVGGSPALTVTAGNVIVNNVAFTTATDAPTILVSGGSLALRDDVVQSSTGFPDAAIAVTGGSVDLGSTSDPGNNTINVSGAGQLVLNTTSTPVSTAGNTFESNGTVLPGSNFSSTTASASSAPVIPGQAVTFTATVGVPAGGSGTPTGNVDFVDATSNVDLGTATLSGGVAQLTAPLSAVGTHVILANYLGDGTFLPSLGSTTQSVTQSIYVLDATASGALNVSGNAGINIPGNLIDDSSSKTALTESGNARITAASVQVVGGVSKSANAMLNPTATTIATAAADPLASLSGPSTSGLTNFGSVSYSKGSYTLKPGIYSQISASGNASVSLSPGLYLVEGGGFTVTGSASVSGSGVTIYNTVSTYPKTGGNYGGISLSGNGTFNLTAATTAAGGAYPGILIDQPRANTRALSLAGNGVAGLNGTIYAPTAQLTVSGNAQLRGALVVDRLSLSGNVALSQTADGSGGSGDTSGIAGTLLAGNLTVYVNDPSGYFTSDELARIQDAINAWDNVLAPYSVTITEVSDPTLANVVVDDSATSASGTAADGVLGCFNTATGEITLLQGWNWYAGAGPTQISAGQYDLETTVLHELGHALGLGHSADAGSPMHGTLAAGVAARTPTTQNLNIPDPPAGADPLLAAFQNDTLPFAVGAASSSVWQTNARAGLAGVAAGLNPFMSSSQLDPVTRPANSQRPTVILLSYRPSARSKDTRLASSPGVRAAAPSQSAEAAKFTSVTRQAQARWAPRRELIGLGTTGGGLGKSASTFSQESRSRAATSPQHIGPSEPVGQDHPETNVSHAAIAPERETPVHEQAVDWLATTLGLAAIIARPAQFWNERRKHRFFRDHKNRDTGKRHG